MLKISMKSTKFDTVHHKDQQIEFQKQLSCSDDLALFTNDFFMTCTRLLHDFDWLGGTMNHWPIIKKQWKG